MKGLVHNVNFYHNVHSHDMQSFLIRLTFNSYSYQWQFATISSLVGNECHSLFFAVCVCVCVNVCTKVKFLHTGDIDYLTHVTVSRKHFKSREANKITPTDTHQIMWVQIIILLCFLCD